MGGNKKSVQLQILLGSIFLMICFFNCGQPGELRLEEVTSNSVSITDPAADENSGQTIQGINEVINTMKPALAVRATGCIMCHANVASNIITDFGFGGNYFFGGFPGSSLPSGLTNSQGKSVYGDYDFSTGGDVNWGSAKLADGVKVIVPKASTEGLDVEAPSLFSYLAGILEENQQAKGAEVKEVKSVYIGAPTAEKIISISGVGIGGIKYIPTKKGAALVGIKKNLERGYYSNKVTDTIVCNGDVVVDGVLWLNQPKIETETGCRFYVTQSVFISGAINFVDIKTKSNLQITSAKMVAIGLGKKCNDSSYGDSLNERLSFDSSSDQYRYAGFFTRNLGAPQQMLASQKADAESVGLLQDASCGVNGRDVGFERLMVNAPVVHSRYQGRFKGLIISEIALLALEALKYEFDPVFSNVLILPLLKPSDYLEIEN